MYSIYDYGMMIADSGRMDAYVQALQQAITPGAVVVDIGAGTGIFALLACRLGARQVYAIEPDNAIAVAKQIAVANGVADKIKFYQDLSSNVTIPEPADIIISDLRGVLPLHQHHIPAIVDARQRLLAPDGILIPQQDTLWAAVVSAPELYRKWTSPWDSKPCGFEMRAVLPWVTNSWVKARITPELMLSEPQSWGQLDYNQINEPNLKAQLNWTIATAGVAHGFCAWFETMLASGISFSNAPGKPEIIYGQAFFPWKHPVALNIGDRVAVTIQANLVNDDYIWSWSSQIFSPGQTQPIKASFLQSTFFANPLSPSQLRKQADTYVAQLNHEGRITQTILQSMDFGKPLGEIATQLAAEFPEHFTSWQAALTRVGEISQRYSH